MKYNWCSAFPDSVNICGMSFDISELCAGHDSLYSAGFGSRSAADKWLRDQLNLAYPEYGKLWTIVYHAVRKFGWIPWYVHAFERFVGWNPGIIKTGAIMMIKTEIKAGMIKHGITVER